MTADHENGDSGSGSPDKSSSSPKSSSSSSSDSSTSTTPSTVSPDDHNDAPELVNEPDGPPPLYHASYSANPPRRGNRRNGPPTSQARLGSIDEHSNSIAPDVPTRHPGRRGNRQRKMVAFLPGDAAKFFSWSTYSKPGEDVPPPDVYDGIVGPRGEKFSDVRKNKPFREPRRRNWRRMLCIGLIVFVILLALGLGIGLGVGLTRRKNSSSNSDTGSSPPVSPNANDSANAEPFPLGTWSIPTYLTDDPSNCTSNPATWRCFPYNTYAESQTASFNTLLWQITSPSNSTIDLRISNTNPTFSYPFSDVPMTLSNTNDERLSAFTFDFVYRKQVIPDADITGDNTATRCYYNDTRVSVRLYSDSQGAGGGIVGPPSGQVQGGNTAEDLWPFAIEFEERIGSAPECYRVNNGVEGAQVDIAPGSGDCICGYRNYGLA